MPGVADAIRKTNLKQEQQARKGDMDELLRMVKEGRLHEADERQLESLKLALELNSLLEPKQPTQSGPTTEELAEAVKNAVVEGMSNITIQGGYSGLPVDDPARPGMKHTNLADLVQTDEKVDISHIEKIKETVEGSDSADKLEKLRKIKGGK